MRTFRIISSCAVRVCLYLGLAMAIFSGLIHSVNAAETYSQWTYSKSITLNTTPSGANVPYNVLNFPVLIRLNAGNFKFDSLNNADGRDIRFSKADGTHLFYQIERCDGGTPDSASIWVRVDTVFGNNSSQTIIIYYGKASLSDSSKPNNVFDTANGFYGVWHMADTTDATYKANNATRAGSSLPASVLSPLGKAYSLDGASTSYFNVAASTSLNGTGSAFTASAWVKPTSVGTIIQPATAMTTNSLPSPYVVSCSNGGFNHDDAWKVFDNDTTVGWQQYCRWDWNVFISAQWMKIDLTAGNAGALISYSVMRNHSTTANLTGWTVAGSNDDAAWTDLDTRSSQPDPLPTTSYTVNGTTSYRYYKFYNFVGDQNEASFTGIVDCFDEINLNVAGPSVILSHKGVANTAKGWEFSVLGTVQNQLYTSSATALTPTLLSSGNWVDGWHHIAWVFNGTTVTPYADGAKKTAQTVTAVADTTIQLSIGNNAANAYGQFNGLIDELRIEKATRDSNWVKLCYNNQSSNQSLVSVSTFTDNPVVGYAASDTIPSAQVTQSTSGNGVDTIRFKVGDANPSSVTLGSFSYSINSGTGWTAVASGSAAFSASWSNNSYSSAATFSGANTYYFTVNTQHADLSGLNNLDQSTVKFRFSATDATAHTGSLGTTQVVTVDNVAPTGMGSFAVGSPTSVTVPLSWSIATENHFNHYEIWYGTSQAGVQNRNGGAVKWSTANNATLATRTTTSTTITGLSASTTYYFKIWAVDNGGYEQTVADVNATTSSSVSENYSLWGYSKNITLKTTGGNANVPYNVLNFPVLLRLNPANFDGFANVSGTGTDLRFAKADGTHLVYGIERYVDNGNNDTAEIWVKVDTVKGNNSTQYITMYWNKASVADSSQPNKVFDTATANGFRGVWHLKDTTDATSIGKTASRNGQGAGPTSSAGLIGSALSFNGSSDYLLAPYSASWNLGSAFTVSFWAKYASGSAFSNYPRLLSTKTTWNDADGWEVTGLISNSNSVTAQGANTSQLTLSNVVGDWTSQAWEYITVTFNSGAGEIYGGYTRQSGSVSSVTQSATNGLGIGQNANNTESRWLGSIDEVRIEKGVRDSNWVKLCYMNQRLVTTRSTDGLDSLCFFGSSTVQSHSPVVGYTASDSIPSAQIVQSTSGNGVDTIRFKVTDPTPASFTLTSFSYSTNSGTAWTSVSSGSAAFSTNWTNNSYTSAATWGAASTYYFTVNTGHTDLVNLNGVDLSTVKFRFSATDGTYTSTNPGTTQVVTVDNLAPSGMGTFAAGTATSSTVPLSWTVATENHFNHYEIWYGVNQSNVQNRNGSATMWSTANDANLSTKTTTSTTITGLSFSSTYYFKIWAVDNLGYEQTVSDINTTTAVSPAENYSLWSYSKPIVINTSSTGANVPYNVLNFPVLVRLNASNFDFSGLTNTDGRDFRFSKADGTHLFYQIERCDGGTPDSAAIWVRVDTVFGNNSTQYINMYYGKESVVDSSRPNNVFDTANGFYGVWHFTDTTDATYKANKATRAGSSLPSSKLGVVGNAYSLNGASTSYFNVAASTSLNGTGGAFTVSAWVSPVAGGTTVAIPSAVMTTNSLPVPYAITTSGFDGTKGNTAYKAFDGDSTTCGDDYIWGSANGVIVLDVGAVNSGALQSYTLSTGPNGAWPPVNTWTLSGSTDNSSYTQLDAQTGVALTSGFSPATYTVNGSTSYRYFKFTGFSAYGGNPNPGGISTFREVKLYLGSSGAGTVVSHKGAANTVKGWEFSVTGTNQNQLYTSSATPLTPTVLPSGSWGDGWRYLTWVFNGTTATPFSNGAKQSAQTVTAVVDTTIQLSIGNNAGNAYGQYNGLIDEVRIEKVVRDSNWIKLCYQNQRTVSGRSSDGGDSLLWFGTTTTADNSLLPLTIRYGTRTAGHDTCMISTSLWSMKFDADSGAGISWLSDTLNRLHTNQKAPRFNLFNIRFGADTSYKHIGTLSLLDSSILMARLRSVHGQKDGDSITFTTDYTIYGSGRMHILTTAVPYTNMGSSKTLYFDVARAKSGTGKIVPKTGTVGTCPYILAGDNGGGALDLMIAPFDNSPLFTAWDTSNSTAMRAGYGYAAYQGKAGQRTQWEFMVDFGHRYWNDTSAITHARANEYRNPDTAATFMAGSPDFENAWEWWLRGQWNFNEKTSGSGVTGDTVFDVTSAKRNGRLCGTPSYVAGKWGLAGDGALSVTAGNYDSITDYNDFDAAGNMTVMAWIKVGTCSASDTIMAKYDLAGSTGWALTGSASNKLAFKAQNGTQVTGVTALNTSTWRHVAAVMSRDGNFAALYVDGRIDTIVTGAAAGISDNSKSLKIGRVANAMTIDDARYYANVLPEEAIRGIARRDYRPSTGFYQLRADQNNTVNWYLSGTANTRNQPIMQIANYWAAAMTNLQVWLNGAVLTNNIDYFRSLNTTTHVLSIGLNKTIADSSRIYIDDSSSLGGAYTATMKKMSWGALGTDYFFVKNLSGTTFGVASTNQFYTGWKMNTATNGGEIHRFKSSNINPSTAFDSSTANNLNPAAQANGAFGYLTVRSGASTVTSNANVAATPTYSIPESSEVRVVMQTNKRRLSNTASCSLMTRWTIYPTGQMFRYDSLYSLSATAESLRTQFYQIYEAAPAGYATKTMQRGGWYTAATTREFAVNFLSYKSGAGLSKSLFSGANDLAEVIKTSATNAGLSFYDKDGLTNANSPHRLCMYMDLQRTGMTQAYVDSLGKAFQSPKIPTVSPGTLVRGFSTSSVGDLDTNGFNEMEGAYIIQADNANSFKAKFGSSGAGDSCLYRPAFRVTNYFATQPPQYVFVNTRQLVKDYNYNAAVKLATHELIFQIDTVLCGNTDSIYMSYDKTLAVGMDKFRAGGGDRRDTLYWQTESEKENAGFYLYRRIKPAFIDTLMKADTVSTDPDNENNAIALFKRRRIDYKDTAWVQVNSEIIPGAESGTSVGPRKYRYVDFRVQNDILYEYRLVSVDFKQKAENFGPVQVKPGLLMPVQFALLGNFPNPFTHATVIRYDLPSKTRVELSVYDLSGRRVMRLVRPDHVLKPGYYRTVWDGRDERGRFIASGPYVYRFSAPGFAKARMMLLLR